MLWKKNINLWQFYSDNYIFLRLYGKKIFIQDNRQKKIFFSVFMTKNGQQIFFIPKKSTTCLDVFFQVIEANVREGKHRSQINFWWQ